MMDGQKYVTHEACAETAGRILEKLESIERRLFRDNGSVSIQTRLDRHEQLLRGALWVFGLIVGGILTAGGAWFVILLRGVMERAGT